MLSSDAFFDTEAMRTLAHAVYGAADFGECIATMRKVPPGDAAAWHREWTLAAARVAAIARSAAAAGHDVSAREAWLRASNYYRTSWLPLFGAPTKPALVEAFARESECFRQFAARTAPPLERIEIPYAGTPLPGWFCPAPGASGRAPTLIATSGYDSTVHELYLAFAVAANRRGWHALIFDGPGQGRMLVERGVPLRPDWENVIRPVVDYALARAEVDPTRIALAGWSLGGYLALRAAGGEHRLCACVADPAFTGFRDGLQRMFADLPAGALADPLGADPTLFEPYLKRIEASPALRWKIVQRAFWVHGVDSLQAYLADALAYDNRDAVRAIRCPVFLAWEENDPSTTSAEEIEALITAPKTLVRFRASEGADGHCAMLARSLLHQRMFDWLDAGCVDAASVAPA